MNILRYRVEKKG